MTNSLAVQAPHRSRTTLSLFSQSWWLPTIVCIGATAAILHHFQVPIQAYLVYATYFLMVILVPGSLVWRAVITRHDRANSAPAFRTLLEDGVCGAAVGYLIETPAYCLARWLGLPMLYLLVPAAILVGFGLMRWRTGSKRAASLHRVGPMQAWSLVGLTLYAVYWLCLTELSKLSVRSLSRFPEIDETFHLAIVGDLRHHFPPVYPFIESSSLPYQWFVHAHMAASTWATGLESVMVYRRFDPVVLTVLAVLGCGVVAMRLSGRAGPGVVASAILVLVGSFDVSGMRPGQSAVEEGFLLGPVLVHSPTQTMGFVLAVPTTLLSLELVRRRARFPPGSWALLVGLLVALSLTKVTFVPVFMAGFFLVAGVETWRQRRLASPSLFAGVAALLVILGSGRLIYQGDSQTLGWKPFATTEYYASLLGLDQGGFGGDLLFTTAMLAGWLLPGIGALGLLLSRDRWRDERVWWLVGASAAGFGALVLLAHGGVSQRYFGRSVAPLVAILSAWGLAELFPRGTSRRRLLRALGAASIGGLLLWGARFLTERWQQTVDVDGETQVRPMLDVLINLPVLLSIVVLMFVLRFLIRDISHGRRHLSIRLCVVFLVGLGLARSLAFVAHNGQWTEAQQPMLKVGDGGVAAARWLREHSEPTDRVITNGHCRPVSGERDCDNRHFWMSALSERRFVLEGWGYTVQGGEGVPVGENTYTSPYFGDPRFLLTNDALFTDPSDAKLEGFLLEHPAEWMLVDGSLPVNLKALSALEIVSVSFQRGEFTVVRIRS